MKPVTIHRIRLSKMQKVINVLAVASAAVSVAVVGSGLYVYVNRGAIIDGIKSQALEAVLGGSGGIGGALGGASATPNLGIGANDLSPQSNPDLAVPSPAPDQASAPQVSSPF